MTKARKLIEASVSDLGTLPINPLSLVTVTFSSNSVCSKCGKIASFTSGGNRVQYLDKDKKPVCKNCKNKA